MMLVAVEDGRREWFKRRNYVRYFSPGANLDSAGPAGTPWGNQQQHTRPNVRSDRFPRSLSTSLTCEIQEQGVVAAAIDGSGEAAEVLRLPCAVRGSAGVARVLRHRRTGIHTCLAGVILLASAELRGAHS